MCNTLIRIPLTVASELGCHYPWLFSFFLFQYIYLWCQCGSVLFKQHIKHIIKHIIMQYILTLCINIFIYIIIELLWKSSNRHLIHIRALSSKFNWYMLICSCSCTEDEGLEQPAGQPGLCIVQRNLCSIKEIYCEGWAHSSVNKPSSIRSQITSSGT